MLISSEKPLWGEFNKLLYYIVLYRSFDVVDGGYGNWSLNATCNVTCGRGFETWFRECIQPGPKYGGRNCSHLGKSVEFRPCFKTRCTGKYTIATHTTALIRTNLQKNKLVQTLGKGKNCISYESYKQAGSALTNPEISISNNIYDTYKIKVIPNKLCIIRLI